MRPSGSDGSAHPRLRGEDPAAVPCVPCFAGAPPPARGRPLSVDVNLRAPRVTPVSTGKTVCRSAMARSMAAHPRAYGEDARLDLRTSRQGGSPPPARGNTVPAKRFFALTRAHPRLRGEDHSGDGGVSPASGPPTPVRGRHQARDVQHGGVRFTPACTGKTWILSSSRHATTAHPRLHGEDCTCAIAEYGL